MKTVTATEREGRRVAARMMEQLRQEWESIDLKGVPDNRVTELMVSREPCTMRRYLAQVQGEPDMERGFLCVLSEWIGCEMSSGNAVDPRHYAQTKMTAAS